MSKNKKVKQPKMSLENSHDNIDPISNNIFWTEKNGIRSIVYPKENFNDLVFYMDKNKHIRCIEKESLQYLKSYNIITDPVTGDLLPSNIFDNINIIELDNITRDKTIEEIALDTFQHFTKISVFIDYNMFIKLDRKRLIKFNYEVRDFWLQNFSSEQQQVISNNTVFPKQENDFKSDSIENIQLYLLNQMTTLLCCDKEEHKYMINYILIGALGIVIPEIKMMYPDFDLSF